MDKPKVSKKSLISLLEQQIVLLDAIEESTELNDAGWEFYFHSAFPDVQISKAENPEIRNSYNLAVHFMQQFRDSVFLGVTPSAVILLRIAEYFDKYLSDDSGKLTLDEAFKLKHRPKIGNPIKQKRWVLNKAAIVAGMWIQKTISELKGKKISILKAASIVINKWNLDADEESLKKEYKSLGGATNSKRGTYPSVEEEIQDLEKAFQDLTEVYQSGVAPKKKSSPKRVSTKNAITELLTSFIEELGKK